MSLPRRTILPIVLLAYVTGCTPPDESLPETPSEPTPARMGYSVTEAAAAADRISPASLASAIETLSSDEFGGRGPSSPGEDRTVEYLTSQFQALDLRPGNGTDWTQDVPLVAITTDGADLTFAADGSARSLAWAAGWVGWTKRVVESVAVDGSELVFVGYGIVAPEYGWDDYAGVDMAGKTAVILVNDPGYATGDAERFRGNAMTYYGRWTYKFEEAARQGAEAALIVHETGAAGYPWEVVASSWTGPQFDLVREDANASRVAIEGWISRAEAEALFAQTETSLEASAEAATQPGFTPRPLGVTMSAGLSNRIERSRSRNVLARVEGRSRPEEVVIYMAHWDHFGTSDTDTGDRIYNGAFDNATGTAGLLELARAFTALPTPPERSVVFLAVTAEEQGLLGSAHYASQPVYPTYNTVAAINMDGLNVDGPMRDLTVVGFGASQLDDVLGGHVESAGRRLRPDPEPEKGFYYRSDHFSFAKVGVPALYTDSGIDHVEHGEAWTMERRRQYTAERYHKPSDEYEPGWDLSGAVEDLRLLFMVGLDLSDSGGWPNWREGNEFKAARDADRRGR